MTEKRKIGIYGGTFNPPHIAHVRACEAFYESIKPDKLLVIPDFLPPHKEIAGGATTEERLEMTRLAFENLPAAEVSDMEIARGGRSYTAVTLSELSAEDNELYFLCGKLGINLSVSSFMTLKKCLIVFLHNILYCRLAFETLRKTLFFAPE